MRKNMTFDDLVIELSFLGLKDIYTKVNMNPEKLQNAIQSFAPNIDKQSVCLLIDDTLFKSSKSGLILTDTEMYIKESFEQPFIFKLADIHEFSYKATTLGLTIYINGNKIAEFSQADSDSLITVFNVLVKYFNQNNPINSTSNPSAIHLNQNTLNVSQNSNAQNLNSQNTNSQSTNPFNTNTIINNKYVWISTILSFFSIFGVAIGWIFASLDRKEMINRGTQPPKNWTTDIPLIYFWKRNEILQQSKLPLWIMAFGYILSISSLFSLNNVFHDYSNIEDQVCQLTTAQLQFGGWISDGAFGLNETECDSAKVEEEVEDNVYKVKVNLNTGKEIEVYAKKGNNGRVYLLNNR